MGFMRAINDIWCSLQPNTVEKYCYSLRNFYQFSLLERGEIILPVELLEASRFLISLRERNYSKFTIKLGLVSIKWANSFFPGAPKLDDPFLSRIVLSAKKNCVSTKRQKEPLSKEMLRKILDLSPNPSLLEVRDALLPAISYTLLLRNDELRHLNCKNISLKPAGFEFRIDSSKTDVFRRGKTLYMAHHDGELSVSKLLQKYLRMARLEMGSNNFLFGEIKSDNEGDYVDGKTQIPYQRCLSIFRRHIESQGADPSKFGTHSARSGGATSLATEVSSFELMVSGRWADPRSIRNYVLVPEQRRFAISRYLAIGNENEKKDGRVMTVISLACSDTHLVFSPFFHFLFQIDKLTYSRAGSEAISMKIARLDASDSFIFRQLSCFNVRLVPLVALHHRS